MIRGIFNWGSNGYTDEEMLNVLKATKHPEEQKAIDYLYSSRLKKFFRHKVFRRLLPNEEERQDAYNDANQILIYNIRGDSKKAIRNIEAYFFKLFHNVCVVQIRKKETIKRGIQKNIATPDINTFYSFLLSSEDPVNKLIQKNKYDAVQKYLTQMGDPCLTIINMMAEGYKAQEVGDLFGLKAVNVRVKKIKCREKLIELLKINKELDHE